MRKTITALALTLLTAAPLSVATDSDSPYDPNAKTLVIATIVLTANGALVDAEVIGRFDTIPECVKTVAEKVKKVGPPPAGSHLSIICADSESAHIAIIQVDGPKPAAEPKPTRGQQVTEL